MKPGDIVMHRCNGEVRFTVSPAIFRRGFCKQCRAPIAPEQPFLEMHAGYQCMYCMTYIGFCAGGLLAAVLDDAERAVRDG